VEETVAAPENTPTVLPLLKGLEKQTGSRAWTSERVEVIVQALTDRHPRPHIAATGGKFLPFLMTKVLPTRIVDGWQRFYGIDLVAKEWQSRN